MKLLLKNVARVGRFFINLLPINYRVDHKFQNKYKLSNELVNAIQTSIASFFAIFAVILYSYFLN